MKKPLNDSLYKFEKYEKFTDSTNFKKANKLLKLILNISLQTVMQCPNCQAKMTYQ